MKNMMKCLVESVLAGLMIGIGGTVFLSMEDKVVGAALFAIGLFVIVTRGFSLFTGKVGYTLEKPRKYLIELAVTLVGNFIGTAVAGLLISETRFGAALNAKAELLAMAKLTDEPFSILVLAIFCGILMFVAVDGFKKGKDNFARYAGVFLGVVVFILCGFEHSIANMFYFTMARAWNLQALGYMGLMVLGNSLGGMLIPALMQAKERLEKRPSGGLAERIGGELEGAEEVAEGVGIDKK